MSKEKEKLIEEMAVKYVANCLGVPTKQLKTIKNDRSQRKRITHRELCELGAKHMFRNGIVPYNKPKYVVCELERIGECPDVFGFGSSCTQLLEIKVSRSDFLSDKRKEWRIHPEIGLGQYRAYLCPKNMIKEHELPNYWGLFYIDDTGKIEMIKKPEKQISCSVAEVSLIVSIMRRESIKNQIFSYKKYNS